MNLKFFIKTYLLAFIVLTLPFSGTAQRDVYNWQLSPYAGGLTVNNDITLPDNTNMFAYGLRIDRRLGEAFTLGINFSYIHTDLPDRNSIAGGFVGLAYYWDNGYLFSKRSVVSIFHRLEAGYTDKTERIENLDGTAGELTFGFENGLKFRLGDRVSAELALEILGSEKSITQGDFTTNLRYNIWKVGVSYHFGNRKSTFRAPVFVPTDERLTNSDLDKLQMVDDSLWIVESSDFEMQPEEHLPDSILPDSILVDTLAAMDKKNQISRADSLAIFMHFDSLYQRRTVVDTLQKTSNTAVSDTLNVQSDSLKTATKSMQLDSVEQKFPADTAAFRTGPKQSADTSAHVNPGKTEVGRVDTVYVVQKVATEPKLENQKRENEKKKDEQKADDSGIGEGSDKKANSINNLNDQVTQNQKDIDKLQSQKNRDRGDNNHKNNRVGTALAAGAAGVAVGALASKDKKHKTDTVFYESNATQAKIDSLQREIDALKNSRGVADSVGDLNVRNVSNVPIGQYYDLDSTYMDSLVPDTMAVDSISADSMQINKLQTDSIRMDTILMDSLILSETGMTSDSLASVPDFVHSHPIDSTSVVVPADTERANIESVKSKAEAHPDSSLSVPPLIADYPVICNFALNSTAIQAVDTVKLNNVVTDLKNDTARRVILVGYTDKSGNPDYNLQLSKRRALRVSDYLTARGINAERIAIESKGSAEAKKNYNENARRVEVRIQE